MIEESLNKLPFTDCEVITPTGALYKGLKYGAGNCGVSIVRSGEAMEQVVYPVIKTLICVHSLTMTTLIYLCIKYYFLPDCDVAGGS